MSNIRAQTVEVRLMQLKEVEMKVIRLANSLQYFLKFVFIVCEEDSCRLVVYRKDEILTNEKYKTVKGAKIAFLKFYSFMAYNEEVRPYWTTPYVPIKKWLEQRLND